MNGLLTDHILGPTGGLVAMAYGVGAVSGYAFAARTIIGEAKKRIATLEEKLEAIQKTFNDYLMGDKK